MGVFILADLHFRQMQPILGKKHMEKVDATIGKSIRHYRWLQGISQTDLANALGISLAQIRSHEAGKSRVTAARLMAIAGHLGVDVAAFFQRNPDKPVPLIEPTPTKARSPGDALQNGKYLAALMTHFQRLNETQKQAVLQLVVSISKEGIPPNPPQQPNPELVSAGPARCTESAEDGSY